MTQTLTTETRMTETYSTETRMTEARKTEPERLLEEMTSPEVARALAEGRTAVVFAVGATEQHGPHLPLAVDALRGDRLAIEVARRLGRDALVAPTIRVGCSEHHMAFPGTLSVRASTLEALCTDYVTSLARHGFRVIHVIPSHGGNFRPLAAMLPGLRAAAMSAASPDRDCTVCAYTDLHGFVVGWTAAVRRAAPGLEDRVGGHADIAESSEMLCIRPDLVQPELAAQGYTGGFGDAVADRIFTDGIRAVTPNGILGDARGMSRAIGEECLARVADEMASFLRRSAERRRCPDGSRPPPGPR